MAASSRPADDLLEYQGRTYQRDALNKQGNFLPVDSTERLRLTTFCEVQQSLLFDVKGLFSPTFFREPPTNPDVLEVGAGTCSWIEDASEEYPDAAIEGIDIVLGKQHSPTDGPEEADHDDDRCRSNRYFNQVLVSRWNLNHRLWHNDEFYANNDLKRPVCSFDVINIRGVQEGIHALYWNQLLHGLTPLLARGGFIQSLEFGFGNIDFRTSEAMCNATGLRRWTELYHRCMQEMSRDPEAGKNMHRIMRSKLRDVQSQTLAIPIGEWDPVFSTIGNRILAQMPNTLKSLVSWTAQEELGRYTEDCIDGIVEAAMDDLRNSQFQPYIPCFVTHGQQDVEES